jgi:hypothetical protein
MWDLSDFDARLARTSATKTVTLFGGSRATVSKVMSACTNLGKITSAERNSGRKSALRRTVSKSHRHSAAEVTTELNIRLEQPVSSKTAWRELHKSNIHGRAATAKPLITKSNAQMRKRSRHNHKTWTSDNWKRARDMSTLFPTSGKVYVLRTPKETYNPECLVPTVKHGWGCVMVSAAISW